MSRFAINPPDEDRYEENPDHAEETMRLVGFNLFVASLRDCAAQYSWGRVLLLVHLAYGDFREGTPMKYLAMLDEIARFAEGYGWPDTLRAIAQAIQADETMKKELEGRR